MDTENAARDAERRADIIAGLAEVANVLHDYPEATPLNLASPVLVDYHIMEDDSAKAAAEFKEASERLRDIACDGTTTRVRLCDDTRHHVTAMPLIGGRVFYRVLWIEKNVSTDSEDDA